MSEWSITDVDIPTITFKPKILAYKGNKRLPRKLKKKIKKAEKLIRDMDFTFSVDYCYNPDIIK